ncbi:MAG: hypothetical protein EON90_07770 [Brevundimonas sp.]|nr:MAG: hypothetical protein EON90_07770 [Brevundimonas sp.]
MPQANFDRRAFGLGLASLSALLPTISLAQTAEGVQTSDWALGGRLNIGVFINGLGPFQFVVDSAANASMISDELAVQLGLPDAGIMAVNTLIDREQMTSVRPALIRAGAMNIESPRLAVATRYGLHGADGLLGSDLLRDLKLVLNFRGRNRVTIRRSAKPHAAFLDPPRPTTRLTNRGERHFGSLISIGVRTNGVSGRAIIDTGAESTIINRAMAAAGARNSFLTDGSREKMVSSPSGRSAPATVMSLNSLDFAGVGLQHVPVLVGDYHVFDVWGVRDQPSMLMGVDILGLFRTVSIDLRRAELVLEI